jgi:hypothetical protein
MRSAKARIPTMVLVEPSLKHICKFEIGNLYHNLFMNEALNFKNRVLEENPKKNIDKMCDLAKKVKDNSVIIDGIARLLEGVNLLENSQKEAAAEIVARGITNLVDCVGANQKEELSQWIKALLPRFSNTTRMKLIEILLNTRCNYESIDQRDLLALNLVLFKKRELMIIRESATSDYVKILAAFELDKIKEDERIEAIERNIDGKFTLRELGGMRFESLSELLMMLKYVEQERVEREERRKREFVERHRVAKPMSEDEAEESRTRSSALLFAQTLLEKDKPILLTDIKEMKLDEGDIEILPQTPQAPDIEERALEAAPPPTRVEDSVESAIEVADPPSGVHELEVVRQERSTIPLREDDLVEVEGAEPDESVACRPWEAYSATFDRLKGADIEAVLDEERRILGIRSELPTQEELRSLNERLFKAVEERNYKRMRYLLRHGAGENATDHSGQTPLMRASVYNSTRAVRILLDAKANINAQDEEGWSALMLAAAQGNKRAVKQLLKNGAKTRIKTNDGQTAQMIASFGGHKKIAELIREYQEDEGVPEQQLASESRNEDSIVVTLTEEDIIIVEEEEPIHDKWLSMLVDEKSNGEESHVFMVPPQDEESRAMIDLAMLEAKNPNNRIYNLDEVTTNKIMALIPPGQTRWGIPKENIFMTGSKHIGEINIEGRYFLIYDHDMGSNIPGRIVINTQINTPEEIMGSMNSHESIMEAFGNIKRKN